jgi:hypothetical protein
VTGGSLRTLCAGAALCLAAAMPGLARAQSQDAQSAGTVSTSSAGTAGQRQTKQDAAPSISPTARIPSRIQNRVQTRLRTRLDRNYAPPPKPTSPFEVAEDQARKP